MTSRQSSRRSSCRYSSQRRHSPARCPDSRPGERVGSNFGGNTQRHSAGRDRVSLVIRAAAPTSAPRPTTARCRTTAPEPTSAPSSIGAALEVREVPDGAVVSDDGVEFGGAVDDRPILDRRARPDPDPDAVTAQDGARPDGRLGTHHHVADDDGIRMNEGRWIYLGRSVAESVQGHGASSCRSASLPAGGRGFRCRQTHTRKHGVLRAVPLVLALELRQNRGAGATDAAHRCAKSLRGTMATDYDAPRIKDEDLATDSLEELKARRADPAAGAVDIDESDLAENLELARCRSLQGEPQRQGAAETAGRVHVQRLLPGPPPQPVRPRPAGSRSLPGLRRLNANARAGRAWRLSTGV